METPKTNSEPLDQVVNQTTSTNVYVPPKVEKLRKLAEVTGVAKMTGLPEQE